MTAFDGIETLKKVEKRKTEWRNYQVLTNSAYLSAML